jgi:hypothetical protein
MTMSQQPQRTPETLRSLLLGTITGLALLGLAGLAGCAGGPGSGVQIEWVNVVQFGGIQYVASISSIGRAPTDADVGPVFATVQFKLADNVHDPSYQLKDGDAAFLDAGTPVSTVRGYAPTFRLVARFASRLTFYEADTDPHARTGADLLDIGGKVHAIGVNSQQDGTTELGVVKDPAQVRALVAMVLHAAVNQRYQERDSATYFIAFHLDDGTAVTRAYWLGSGELARGILLPQAFGDAVRHALAARSAG